ncbi:MAG: hypothetical protein Alpg2KO_23980 [Alphaproteobacteria bacterium]
METLLAGKAWAVGLWLALLLVAERLRPLAPDMGLKRTLPRWGRVAVLFAINSAMSLAVVLPVTALAADHAPWTRPDALPVWASVIASIILLDVWIYWWHRANHEIPFLWQFHEVHHLDETLDVTSAVRFHFGEVFLAALVRAAVVWAAAIPFWHVVVFETMVLLNAAFHHSNIALPRRVEAALSRLIVTPSIHWVHHHAIRSDTDSNYANFLSIWDRLFGSASPTTRTPEMKIGVEGKPDHPWHALLIRPFRVFTGRR